MKITIQSTTKIVELGYGGDTIPARIWEGETESGIKVHCFITRVVTANDETRAAEFRAELEECREPSKEIELYPLRLIL